jgi:hypothetical protein
MDGWKREGQERGTADGRKDACRGREPRHKEIAQRLRVRVGAHRCSF